MLLSYGLGEHVYREGKDFQIGRYSLLKLDSKKNCLIYTIIIITLF